MVGLPEQLPFESAFEGGKSNILECLKGLVIRACFRCVGV